MCVEGCGVRGGSLGRPRQVRPAECEAGWCGVAAMGCTRETRVVRERLVAVAAVVVALCSGRWKKRDLRNGLAVAATTLPPTYYANPHLLR